MQPDDWFEVLSSAFRLMPVLAAALGLIVGMIVIVFASLLEHARELAEENAAFL